MRDSCFTRPAIWTLPAAAPISPTNWRPKRRAAASTSNTPTKREQLAGDVRWRECQRMLSPQREHRAAAGVGDGQQRRFAQRIASVGETLSELANKDAGPEQAFVRLAFEQILNRDPSMPELDECQTFLKSQAELLREPEQLTPLAGGPKATVPPSADPIQRARENLTLVLYNHNDFITIR